MPQTIVSFLDALAPYVPFILLIAHLARSFARWLDQQRTKHAASISPKTAQRIARIVVAIDYLAIAVGHVVSLGVLIRTNPARAIEVASGSITSDDEPDATPHYEAVIRGDHDVP